MEEAVFGRGSVAEQTACWTVACWGSGRGLGLLLFLRVLFGFTLIIILVERKAPSWAFTGKCG